MAGRIHVDEYAPPIFYTDSMQKDVTSAMNDMKVAGCGCGYGSEDEGRK